MKLVARSKTELVYLHNGKTIRAILQPKYTYCRCYYIYDGDALVGKIEKSTTSHDRKPRGAVVVTSRTYSEWWHHYAIQPNGGFGYGSKSYNNTAASAIQGIVGN